MTTWTSSLLTQPFKYPGTKTHLSFIKNNSTDAGYRNVCFVLSNSKLYFLYSFHILSLSRSLSPRLCSFVKSTSWRVITPSLCREEKERKKDVAVCQLSWSERSKWEKAVGEKGQQWRVPFKNTRHITSLHHSRDSSLHCSNQTAIAIQIQSLCEWHLSAELNLLCNCSHSHSNVMGDCLFRERRSIKYALFLQISELWQMSLYNLREKICVIAVITIKNEQIFPIKISISESLIYLMQTKHS